MEPINKSDENKDADVIKSQGCGSQFENNSSRESCKSISMRNLIIWNVAKAYERNPDMDLKALARTAQKKLEAAVNPQCPSAMISDNPEEQHLQCALLAWRQLGHTDADSLYNFIDSYQKEELKAEHEKLKQKYVKIYTNGQRTKLIKGYCGCASVSNAPHSVPDANKYVMRVETEPCMHKLKAADVNKDIKKKLEKVCCLDSECLKWLNEMDAATAELRDRADKLAKREANKVLLLERAEAAWKDLEKGYLKRLSLALEKEEELKKTIERTINERNNYKLECTRLTKQLKDSGDMVEKSKIKMAALDKEVQEKAQTKMKLCNDCKRRESELVDQQIRNDQFERNIQLKDDQLRRNLTLKEKDLETARMILLEVERTIRAELKELHAHCDEITSQLLVEEEMNTTIKNEIEELIKEKTSLTEAIEGCLEMCDKKRSTQIEQAQKLRAQLEELHEKVIECQCKMPKDATVEVKRTPSFAMLCHCVSHGMIMDSCSCISMQTKIMSNLLENLFGGLLAEVSDSSTVMPCQLLKCLQDDHNWDRSSQLKNNLKDYFSRLLVGELNIAITNSLEKYHAQWIANSCVDTKLKDNEDTDGQRNTEKQAQEMASTLTEQLHLERSTKQKKEVNKAPPLCSCAPNLPPKTNHHSLYPVLIDSKFPTGGINTPHLYQRTSVRTSYWKRTIDNVAQIKNQIDDLKKDVVKKDDLKLIKLKIEKIVKQTKATKKRNNSDMDSTKSLSENRKTKNPKIRPDVVNRKSVDSNNSSIKSNQLENLKRHTNIRHGKTYAVNLCLCDNMKQRKPGQKSIQKPSKINSTVKRIKPTRINSPQLVETKVDKLTSELYCSNGHNKCLHTIPSNKSINRLFQLLTTLNTDNLTKLNQYRKHTKSILTNKNNKNKVTETNSLMLFNEQGVGNKSPVSKEFENQSPDLNKILITDSLYMGAIYFDKSNEDTCNDENHDRNNKSPENSDENEKHLPGYMDMLPVLDFCQVEKLNHNEDEIQITVSNSKYINLARDNNLENIEDKEMKNNHCDELNNCINSMSFLGVTLGCAVHSKNSNKNDKVYYSATSDSYDKYTEYLNVPKVNINTKTKRKKSQRRVHKDKSIDLQSFKKYGDSEENCVCCNLFNQDVSNDLELNTISALENYLKEKIDEFKLNSCRSSCITPEEEEKNVFSMIEKGVKQIISDCTRNIKHKCSDSTCWSSRAHKLLQEYLNIKIKRIRRFSELKENVYDMLPNISEKVCEFIENDFKRLTKMCKCNTTNHIYSQPQQHEYASKESINQKNNLPKYDVKKTHIRKTENKQCSNITLTDIMTSISSNFQMRTKSCEVVYTAIKEQQTETDMVLKINKSQGTVLANNDLNHCIKEYNNKGGYTIDLYGTNDISVNNVSTDVVKQTEEPHKNIDIYGSLFSEIDENKIRNAKFNINNINSLHDNENKISEQHFGISYKRQHGDNINVRNDEEINFKNTRDKVKYNGTTNTYDQDTTPTKNHAVSDGVLNIKYFRTNTIKLANSVHFSECPGSYIDKSTITNVAQTCYCDKVPLCHVKMLLKDIENNLIQSKCTCDSLIADLCPVHSNRL